MDSYKTYHEGDILLCESVSGYTDSFVGRVHRKSVTGPVRIKIIDHAGKHNIGGHMTVDRMRILHLLRSAVVEDFTLREHLECTQTTGTAPSTQL